MRSGYFGEANIESINFYNYIEKANIVTVLNNTSCTQSVHGKSFLNSLVNFSYDGLFYEMNLNFNTTEDFVIFVDGYGKSKELISALILVKIL